jgi:hypothetical protein
MHIKGRLNGEISVDDSSFPFKTQKKIALLLIPTVFH